MQILPNNDNSCGWIETLPPRSANSTLMGEKHAKWLIIGAGYSGLSAAITLAENCPNDEIILIDANKAGEGASSRNSGYLVDSTLNDGHLSDTDFDAYKSKYELNHKSVFYVKSLIEKYSIDCDWNECGKYYASADLNSEKKLKQFHHLLNDLNIKSSLIEREKLTQNLGIDFYKTAVKVYGGAMLQPAALARGMVNNLPRNVHLYENTPVLSISKGQPHKVIFQKGFISAENVIVAVNGFMPSLNIKKNRVFPLLLTASLTRPLTRQEQQQMNHTSEWGVLSANPMGATVRYTSDKRIMIRNTVDVSSSLQLSPSELAKKQKIHLQGLQKRFPFLPTDVFKYCWSGITCISSNNANVFEQTAKNFWTIGCYNGGGIGLATLFGQQIAYQAMDKLQPITKAIIARKQASYLPPQPFLNIGVRAKLAIDRLHAKKDN